MALTSSPVPTPRADAAEYLSQGWWRPQTLRSGLEAVADTEPERVAVVDREGSWTYGALRALVGQSTAALQAAHLEPGDAVLLIAPNRCASIVAFAAIMRAAGVVVALDRRCGATDVMHALSATRPRLIIAPANLWENLRLGSLDPAFQDLDELPHGYSPDVEWEEPDWLAPRIVLFTSGTTSRPKAVVHHLDSFSAGVDNLAESFGWSDHDAPFLCSPLASITGLSQVMLSLRGGRIVLEDEFGPARSVDLLERQGASLLGGPPVILEALFAEYDRRASVTTSLRTVSLGGSMIPPDVLSKAIGRFGVRAVRVYGSSEAPTHTASAPGAAETTEIPRDEGLPMGGGRVQIGSSAAPDEVLVRGPNLFQGYLSSADNDDAFADGWFRTGDLGELAGPDRRLTVRGRLKEVVVRKGVKLSLPEIDDAIGAYPGAVEGAAFGLPDADTGERLAVALHMAPGASATYAEVCDHLRGLGLATGKLPEQVDIWPVRLPRTPSGKIQRRALGSPPPDVHSEMAPRLGSPH
jgi:acyl-CoA synthetase (AMP-forming)/AMP-acid ligase II